MSGLQQVAAHRGTITNTANVANSRAAEAVKQSAARPQNHRAACSSKGIRCHQNLQCLCPANPGARRLPLLHAPLPVHSATTHPPRLATASWPAWPTGCAPAPLNPSPLAGVTPAQSFVVRKPRVAYTLCKLILRAHRPSPLCRRANAYYLRHLPCVIPEESPHPRH